MKEFINFEDMEQTLLNLYKKCLDENDAAKYESTIEEYAHINAESICEDMNRYVHRKDTRMDGNFCNIREDWEETYDFIGSEVKPWGKFDDVIKSIDNKTISDEDLKKFQTWCKDWFFRAFGTWGLCYNFQELISEMEWEEEHAA
jgi:hypothetical protein